jgi:hypothetical protein
MSDANAKNAAKVAMGAVQELARQGGVNVGSSKGVGAIGGYAVSGAAAVAPVVVAKAGALTAAAMAGGAAAAAAAVPFVAVGAVGYGVYRLVKWLDS